MNSFSVIIPTLWRSKKIYDVAEKMSKCELIEEIIIINNNRGGEDRRRLPQKKVRLINQDKNKYVNPSWNKGVHTSRCENICLCNDDIDFKVQKTFELLGKIDISGIGLIGTEKINKCPEGEIYLEHVKEMEVGYGCLMFVHKCNYRKIPERMKIYWGDEYLFRTNNPNFRLKNIGIKGKYSASVDEFKEETKKDTKIYRREVLPELMSENNSMPVIFNKLLVYSRYNWGIRKKLNKLKFWR